MYSLACLHIRIPTDPACLYVVSREASRCSVVDVLSSSHHGGSKPLSITLKHIALLENHKTSIKCRSAILLRTSDEQVNSDLARPDNCEVQSRHSGPAQYSRNCYSSTPGKPDRCSGAGGEFAVVYRLYCTPCKTCLQRAEASRSLADDRLS